MEVKGKFVWTYSYKICKGPYRGKENPSEYVFRSVDILVSYLKMKYIEFKIIRDSWEKVLSKKIKEPYVISLMNKKYITYQIEIKISPILLILLVDSVKE